MVNELDELMSRIYSSSGEELAAIYQDDNNLKMTITYMRQQRALHEAGVKPKKKEEPSQGAALIEKLKLSGQIAAKPKEKRRA